MPPVRSKAPLSRAGAAAARRVPIATCPWSKATASPARRRRARHPFPGSGDGQFLGPQGMALDGAGILSVTDTGNHRVQQFNTNTGQFLRAWGVRGSSLNAFINPADVAVFGGAHYVADTSNQRVLKFRGSSHFLLERLSGAASLFLPGPAIRLSRWMLLLTWPHSSCLRARPPRQRFESFGERVCGFCDAWHDRLLRGLLERSAVAGCAHHGLRARHGPGSGK